MKKIFISLAMLLCLASTMWGIDFSLKGNATSSVLVLKDANGNVVTPSETKSEGTSSVSYAFTNVALGNYTIEGYTSDKTIKLGELLLPLTADNNGTTVEVSAVTTGCSNSGWALDTDYTIENLKVTSTSGNAINSTLGGSKTANRVTILLFKGNSYTVDLIPSAARQAEGYAKTQGSGTVMGATANNNITIYKAAEYKVVVDNGIKFQIAWKTGATSSLSGKHFVPLNFVEPTNVESAEGKTTYTFTLTDQHYYMYRYSADGKRTQAGYFQFSTTTENVPNLDWTMDDFGTASNKTINHNPSDNGAVNVADIYLNVNEKGYLNMNLNDQRDILVQRNWQVINTTTGNYFVEPDYHFTVVNENGVKDNSVITLDSYDTTGDPWTRIKAVGEGTAIVLVTYDALKADYYAVSNKVLTKSAFVYGNEWSALWPENTGVFVVTVGKNAANITPNMLNAGDLNLIKEGANAGKYTRTAGPNVDAELDVFYFTGDAGYEYSFRPEGAKKVEVAYPTIGENAASYSGFGSEGVSYNSETGYYTVILKHGSQIVRLTDESGNCTYQVLRAKKTQYEVINESRPGKQPQAGDKLKVQYSGLYHPCNKLSGIYNMTGSIAYNDVLSDGSVYGGNGQYTFCGLPAAQAFSIAIPKDYDAEANPNLIYNNGYLRANGFGSDYGAHRAITREVGASMNGTASQITAFFGKLPDISIAMAVAPKYGVKFNLNVEDATITLKNDEGAVVAVAADGYYYGIEGAYTYSIEADGYKRIMDTKLFITDQSPALQTIDITLEALGANDWDGKTLTEPAKDANNVYQIGKGSELAWFAKTVNDGAYSSNAVLTADFDLGSYDWTPIGGTTSAKSFTGSFNGNGHTVSGLYINTTNTYAGLFGYSRANLSNIIAEGKVTTTGNYAGGIAAYQAGISASDWRTISGCVSHVTVSGATYVGGIVGQLTSYGAIENSWNDGDVMATTTSQTAGSAGGIVGYANNANSHILNCYNLGNITAPTNVAGIAGNFNTSAKIENVFNLGTINMTTTTTTVSYIKSGAIVGAASTASAFANVKNAYATTGYTFEKNTTIVAESAFLSGEVAYKLGEAFGQDLTNETHPVIGGVTVAYDDATQTYYNVHSSKDFAIANFDDITVDPSSGLYHPEAENDETCYWNSGDYTFATYTDDAWGPKYYYDIVVSNSKSNTFASYADQYNSSIGAAKSGDNYAVWDDNFYGTAPVMLPNEMKLSGFYVTNTAWVVDAVLNGDGASTVPGGFADGDYFKLVITGYDIDDEETGSVTYTLAECTGNTIKYVKNWRWVDLTGLGDKVMSLKFKVIGTKANSYGLTTPAYFCIDDFGGVAPETDAPMEEYAKSGINDVINTPASSSNAQRYDILGRMINGKTNGVNIVRNADGTTEKVIIAK